MNGAIRMVAVADDVTLDPILDDDGVCAIERTLDGRHRGRDERREARDEHDARTRR